MMNRLTLRAMLLGGVCMLPLGAMAADLGAPAAPPQAASENEIDFGLGGAFGTNTGQAGRYNGFTEEGLDGLFAFRSETRNDTHYYIFTGSDINFQFGDNLGTAQVPTISTPGGGAANATTSNIVNSSIKNFSDPNYRNLTDNDLGPNASVKFDVGDQGKWGVIGYYDAISYTGNIIDSIYTMNGNHGVLNNGLCAFGGPCAGGASTSAITSYNALAATTTTGTAPVTTYAFPLGAFLPEQMGTRRDIVGLTGKYTWGDWTINGAVRHEHKEGSVEESFSGTYTGTTFALPVDYDTDRYDVSAAYNTYQMQAVFGYYLSKFTDNYNGVYLPNALEGTGSTVAQRTSLYATPPSNLAQYFTAMLGYNITPTTRVNVNARYGLESMNEGILGSGNANGVLFAPGTGNAVPDITAEVYQGNIGVTSAPMTNLSTSAKYSVDGRNVDSNMHAVYGVASTSSDNSSQYSSNPAAFAVPQEWLKQKVNLEADYRLLPASNTRISAGYEFDDTERSNAQVGRSWQNTGTLTLSSDLGAGFNGRVVGSVGDRSGTVQFWEPWTNLTGSLDTGVPSVAFYQAPMTDEAVSARLDYATASPFSAGVSFKYENDAYSYPSTTAGLPAGTAAANIENALQGVQNNHNLTAGVDGNYRVNEALNLHAYYTFEQIYFDSTGNGACSGSNTGTCAGSVGYNSNKYTNDTSTVGLSADWKANDRLKLTANYTFAYGDVMFSNFNGVFITPSTSITQQYQNAGSYPNEPSVMNQLTVQAKYKLTENIDLMAGVGWSMFKMSNWQDGVPALEQKCTNGVTGSTCGANSNAINNINPGYASPDYNVGMVMAGLRVKW